MSQHKSSWGPAASQTPTRAEASEEQTVERERPDRERTPQRNGHEQHPRPSGSPTLEAQNPRQAHGHANGARPAPTAPEEPTRQPRPGPEDDEEEFGPTPAADVVPEPSRTADSPAANSLAGPGTAPPSRPPEEPVPSPPGRGVVRRAGGGVLSRAVKKISGRLSRRRTPGPRLSGTVEPGSPPDLPDPSAGASELEEALVSRPSEEAVEERITLALRETTIEGFARIAVGSPKGGVGKSSLAYAVAGFIAYYTNIRVCLVDADPEFGATRMMVPRPIPFSIVDIARDADRLHRLSDIRGYIAQNERMRVDVALNPPRMADKGAMGDLPAAYERIDEVLGRVYDLVIYDLGIGFSHPQIQKILSFSDELLLVGDSEVVSNAIFDDALDYLRNFGLDLKKRGALCINHRNAPVDESAATAAAKAAYRDEVAHMPEVPYDAAFSQLLNRRAMHPEDLTPKTRLGVLTTAASCLAILRERDAERRRDTAGEATDHRLTGGL